MSSPLINVGMEDKEKKEILSSLIDTMTDKPVYFSLDTSCRFCIYPQTIGVSQLIGRVMDKMDISRELMNINSVAESYRMCSKHRDEALRIIAYSTIKSKAHILDDFFVEERIKKLSVLDTDGLVKLLMIVLTRDNVEQYREVLGIKADMNERQRVLQAKSATNSFDFGGKSLYGALIDAAANRYGWTYDYIVWGISLTNLQLMMEDQVSSVYLSDEELKKVGKSDKGDVIDANDPANGAIIDKMLSNS